MTLVSDHFPYLVHSKLETLLCQCWVPATHVIINWQSDSVGSSMSLGPPRGNKMRVIPRFQEGSCVVSLVGSLVRLGIRKSMIGGLPTAFCWVRILVSNSASRMQLGLDVTGNMIGMLIEAPLEC